MTTEIDSVPFTARIISNNRITIPPIQMDLLELNQGNVIEVKITKIIKKQEDHKNDK